jgi:fido (protein-threonine AMPylation protein)
MANLKERSIKGKKYLYVYSSLSFKGEKKVFEKSIGQKNINKKLLKRKRKFYSEIVDLKKELYLTYLETKYTKFKHLPDGYAFPLVNAKRQYQKFLSKLYPNDLEKYREEFEIRYVHNTTAIEGNTLTLQETAMILDKGMVPKTSKLREIYEIENYKRLSNYKNEYRKDVNLKFICKIHEFIQRNIDDDSAGCTRRIPIAIKGSEWEPPPALVVKEELDDLLKWYEKNKKNMNPLELGGVFHHRFLQIHPFKDGNGRVARELFNFILEMNDYPPIIIPISRGFEYFELLAKADKKKITPLLEFFAICMLEDYAKAISSLIEDILLIMAESSGELSKDESEEILQLVIWFISLNQEFIKKMPKKIEKKMKDIFGLEEVMDPVAFFNKLI